MKLTLFAVLATCAVAVQSERMEGPMCGKERLDMGAIEKEMIECTEELTTCKDGTILERFEKAYVDPCAHVCMMKKEKILLDDNKTDEAEFKRIFKEMYPKSKENLAGEFAKCIEKLDFSKLDDKTCSGYGPAKDCFEKMHEKHCG